MKGQKNKKSGSWSFLKLLTVVIAGAVFLYAAWQMGSYLLENYKSERDRNKLVQQAVTVLTPSSGTKEKTAATETSDASGLAEEPTETEESLSDTIPLAVDFAVLQSENPDIVAWIYCEDTPINYPVAQGEDNQYYLHRLTDGSYNSSGTIFMDFRNAADFSDHNTLVYGHNMTNDSMFGTLVDYKSQDYFEEHPQLWILTPACAYRVDLFAGFVTASDSGTYTIFETKEELDAHILDCVASSTFSADYDLASIERIVTLSTCSYEYNTARYVVVGNMVPIDYPA